MAVRNECLKIKIRAFGPLRDFIADSMELKWQEGYEVSEYLELLESKLFQGGEPSDTRAKFQRVMQETAVAQNGSILKKTDVLLENYDLLLLPPVCGG